jgi:excinuclease ABC subunit C
VIRDLKKKMETAAANLDFEKAAKFRDRIRLIERLDERGTVEYNQQPEVFAADPKEANEKLAALLGSESPIRTIEGFDIAHLGGTDTVGSLVKFIDGRPFKDGYRRFRIKTVKGIDDYASLQEVVRRRYRYAAEGEELWPDLILIDGGIGQLHAIEEVMATFKGPKPYLASLAKRDEIIYISGMDKELRLAPNSPVRKLFQYVRDEAHRFAQHYHHILRNKSVIPAVDKKKK